MGKDSNRLWENADNYNDWELRRYRFTVEMREAYFHYLRIRPGNKVLDGGCGTGVFTRYIARGLQDGEIVGFDLSRKLVDYGNDKIRDEGLSEVAQLVVEDGFNLSFEDGSFDAVTSYTYLGVLSDPAAGLKECIRVCRPGGAVSAVMVSAGMPAVRWKGEYPFDRNDRLNELYERQDAISKAKINTTSSLLQSEEWHAFRYPKMFEECGLRDISIYPVAHGFSYDDRRWLPELRRYQIDVGLKREIELISERSKMIEFNDQYGFSQKDFGELIELLKAKRRYLLENIEADASWEWFAGLGLVVVGLKPADK
ncbi:MAG TPA: methyltransferase domain-containing protein [Methanocella sp.]|nr:methyltransferase domain-containing protein [Methanocella sp.]